MNIYKRLIRHLYNKAFPDAVPKIDPIIKPMQIVFKTIEPECLKSAVILNECDVEPFYRDNVKLYPDFVQSRLMQAMEDKIKAYIKVDEVIGYMPGTKEYIGTLKVIPFERDIMEVKT